MSRKLQDLRKKLTEIFQLDQTDLDFGIYRIMNQKAKDVTEFLDEKLLPEVKNCFADFENDGQAKVKAELDKLVETLKQAGMNPDDSPKVLELRVQLSNAVDVNALENEVFSHLTSFFSRYYQGGDFLSLRRYKKDIYAIPYEGEEVKLHWANADQYYIKSSENFRDYSFKTSDDKTVHFKLVEAEAEKDNNKTAKDKERRFILCTDEPLFIENGELFIRFNYIADDSKTDQTKHNTQAIEAIITQLTKIEYADFKKLLELKPTEKNKDRTVLEKHLTDYTAKNTFDYFIHKDLGGFLRRELDFYIKNEVLFLDDLDDENIKQSLNKAKAIKKIAGKVIDFLEQLENFQKKLWLKKKFVVESEYCLTLDKVPEELYQEVAENNLQWEEWEKLGFVEDEDGLRIIPPSPLKKGGAEGGGIITEGGQINLFEEKGLISNGHHLPYNPKNIEKARDLRKNLTPAEKKLWYDFLRTQSVRILRQRPIDNYIVDFYCPTAKLVIEIDGDSHFTAEGKEYDKQRTAVLEAYGLKELRFTNADVMKHFEGVCEEILGFINVIIPPAPLVDGFIPPAPLNKGGIGEEGIETNHSPLKKGGVEGGGIISLKKGGIGEGNGTISTPLLRGQGGINEIINFLKQNPYLVLDTKFFSPEFKEKLLEKLPNLDEQTDGLLINADNFNALNLLQSKVTEKIKCIYIDPPYNTGTDEFIYKDNYKDSSWICMMKDRLTIAKSLLKEDGLIFCSIDDNELYRLKVLMDEVFGENNHVSTVAVKMSRATGVKMAHEGSKPVRYKEYGLIYCIDKTKLNLNPQYIETKELDDRYNKFILNIEENPKNWIIKNLSEVLKEKNIKTDEEKIKFYYENASKISRLAANDQDVFKATKGQQYFQEVITSTGLKKYAFDGQNVLFYKGKLKNINGEFKFGENVGDLWFDVVDHINDLSNEGGVTLVNGKKPEFLLERVFNLCSDENTIILDFCLGSGTSSAVAQKMKRKWIGLEGMTYFNELPLTRMKRVLYGEQRGISKYVKWKGSGFFKYMKLESYEDALNNLKPKDSAHAQLALNTADENVNEKYMLSYMMDFEYGGSLLNIDIFKNPFDYKMKITNGTETKTVKVDLVETFNYLIGLNVRTMYNLNGFKIIEGYNRNEDNILVIWRNLNPLYPPYEGGQGGINDDLDELFKKLRLNPRDYEFDRIYVNGDNNLENLKLDEESWKVTLIEEEFKKRMFDVQDV